MRIAKYLIVIFACSTIGTIEANAQKILPSDLKQLKIKGDTLKAVGDSMINAIQAGKRFESDSLFIRTLIRALKTPNSFYYPFDEVKTVSRLYAPDSSFRIFTWQLVRDEYFYLQHGAIQYRTKDGSLKLVALHDVSSFIGHPQDSVRGNTNWIGAIYYKIVQKKYKGKDYYTLIGFDGYGLSSNRKWIEVLTFDEKTGNPVFGGKYFSYKEDTAHKKDLVRFYIEYKKEATANINYDPEMDMIVFDHLVSETNEPDRKETYVPDGDFEGFKWKDGQWVHVDKIFTFKLKDGQEPVERTIRDKDGKINEEELIKQSQKNMEKKN